MNILDNTESLLFCFHIFVVKTSSVSRRALDCDPDCGFKNITIKNTNTILCGLLRTSDTKNMETKKKALSIIKNIHFIVF